MRVVDFPELYPGCCTVSGDSEGPLLDLEEEMAGRDGRGYLAVARIKEWAEHLGFLSPQAAAGLHEQLAAAEERIAELEPLAERLAYLEEVLGYTLQHGIVVDSRSGALKLRAKPGRPAYKLPAVEAVEA